MMRIPPGCPFNPRCRYAQDICRADPPPPLREVVYGRMAACHFSELVLAHSPELEVTQTVEDVQAALEYGPEPEVVSEPDRIAETGRGPGGQT